MSGFHVLLRPDGSDPFFMEVGVPIKGFYIYEPDSLNFTGKYPFATLVAKKGDVEATMEVYSSIVPGNLDDSSIPGFGLSIKVNGSKSGKVAVGAGNIAGSNLVGRTNRIVKNGITFTNMRCNNYDGAKGELCVLAEAPAEICTQYNLNVRPGVAIAEKQWKYTFESDEPWKSVIKGALLKDDPHESIGQWDDIVAQGVVWDQPSRIDGRTGKPDPETLHLDHYIGSPAPWTFSL